MLRLSKPRVWNVYMPGNAELDHELGFESFMFEVEEYTKQSLEGMSVFKFYSLLNHIKSKGNG